MPKLFRGWPLLACLMAGGGLCNGASASELTLSRDGIQAIVLAEVFNDQGKWYFAKGVCYAYVDRPHVSLAAGRVIIDGHLSARVGLVAGDSCAGTDFASDVRVSGRLIGSGSQITLNDIRIDNVKDDSTRQALDLLQSAAGTSLPRAVHIDLLELVKPTMVPDAGIKVAVTGLDISAVTTQPEKVTVQFELKLNAVAGR